MSTADAQQRVYDEIVGVLNEFRVPYTHTVLKKHPAFMFDVGSKHLTFTYSGGDPRAHLNARADIRRLLLSAGAVAPIKETVRETLLNGTAGTRDDAAFIEDDRWRMAARQAN